MAIDDPIEAFKKQYPEEEDALPKALALSVAKLVLPGFVVQIIDTVCGRLSRTAQAERTALLADYRIAAVILLCQSRIFSSKPSCVRPDRNCMPLSEIAVCT